METCTRICSAVQRLQSRRVAHHYHIERQGCANLGCNNWQADRDIAEVERGESPPKFLTSLSATLELHSSLRVSRVMGSENARPRAAARPSLRRSKLGATVFFPFARIMSSKGRARLRMWWARRRRA